MNDPSTYHAGSARLDRLMALDPTAVFVFGSNTRGVHGRGAALAALQRYGAKRGLSWGLQGRSYAIPTRKYDCGKLVSLPLAMVQDNIRAAVAVMAADRAHTYLWTRVGCGLAGFTNEQMAAAFAGMVPLPSHVVLPREWVTVLGWTSL